MYGRRATVGGFVRAFLRASALNGSVPPRLDRNTAIVANSIRTLPFALLRARFPQDAPSCVTRADGRNELP